MSENSLVSAERFLLLAAFWQPPTEDFWHELSCGAIDEEFRNDNRSFQKALPPLSVLQAYFTQTFIGTGKSAVLPVESLYKKWTDDPTARLPIAGSTGYLMGDPALHMQYLLDYYDLVVPTEYRMMPDHLVLLLELAAFIVQKRSPQEIQAFLAQHFDWLDKFETALGETVPENEPEFQAKGFYQLVLQTLQKTLADELMKYSTDEEKNT